MRKDSTVYIARFFDITVAVVVTVCVEGINGAVFIGVSSGRVWANFDTVVDGIAVGVKKKLVGTNRIFNVVGQAIAIEVIIAAVTDAVVVEVGLECVAVEGAVVDIVVDAIAVAVAVTYIAYAVFILVGLVCVCDKVAIIERVEDIVAV